MNMVEVASFKDIRVGDEVRIHKRAVDQYLGVVVKRTAGNIWVLWSVFGGTKRHNVGDTGDAYVDGSFKKTEGYLVCYRKKKPLIIINK